METLENIIQSGRERAPAQDEVKQENTTQAAPEKEAVEQTTEQQPETTEGEQTAESGKPAPIGAIRQAEREKATKRYTEQVADFDKRLAEQEQAWERRFNKLLETVKPPQQQSQPPDFYENPVGATLHTVAPQLDEFRSVMVHNSRLIAEGRHGEDLVTAADTAFTQAYESGKIDPADAQRVLRSPNIYDAAVKWHQRQKAIEEIGPDPSAYRERLKAELMAELGAQQTGQQQTETQQRPAVMPSNLAGQRNVGNRSGPAWGGPETTATIFATNRAARGVR